MTGQQAQQLGNERREIDKSGAACGQHKNRQRQGTEVLLILDILIGGNERVESRRRQLQQLTVFDASPASPLHRFNFMALKKTGLTSWQ